jgi:hypothetical protein
MVTKIRERLPKPRFKLAIANDSLVKALHWYNGPARKMFGPEPGALIPLNLMAAIFSHSHNDVSMRILHGYTSIGLLPGLVGAAFLCRKQAYLIFPVVLLMVNVFCLPVNTWISVKGMGIPYGKQFHVLIAALILVNFLAIDRLRKSEDLITPGDR